MPNFTPKREEDCEAWQLVFALQVNGMDGEIGDYLVRFSSGRIELWKKADFEAKYQVKPEKLPVHPRSPKPGDDIWPNIPTPPWQREPYRDHPYTTPKIWCKKAEPGGRPPMKIETISGNLPGAESYWLTH